MNNLCCLINPFIICACGGKFCHSCWFVDEQFQGSFYTYYKTLGGGHLEKIRYGVVQPILGTCTLLKQDVQVKAVDKPEEFIRLVTGSPHKF